jgi:hypothetical protein
VNDREFRNQYLGEPKPTDHRLLDLAREYYRRTEAYDRTVCTGPMTRDGIMPATYRERGLINHHAGIVLSELRKQAERQGFTKDEFRSAMRLALEMGVE